MSDTATEPKVRLFHTILPLPECCGGQMRLAGNMNLHEVRYQCNRCFKYLSVSVRFDDAAKSETDASMCAAHDATP